MGGWEEEEEEGVYFFKNISKNVVVLEIIIRKQIEANAAVEVFPSPLYPFLPPAEPGCFAVFAPESRKKKKKTMKN